MKNLLKKLYNQNCRKYPIERRFRCVCGCHEFVIKREFPGYNEIETNVVVFAKYTIVELAVNGKHYHGLGVKSDSDDMDDITGIAIAYNRAFQALVGV